MDLLKKYVIKINMLIRNNNEITLSLYDKYNKYLEEPKKLYVFTLILFFLKMIF